MGFLETSFPLSHKHAIPAGVDKATAIAKLHDHIYIIDCGPYVTSRTPQPSPAWDSYDKPKGVTFASEKVDVHEVRNKYENPIMGSDIKSTYYFIDTTEGVFIRVHSPMGTVIESIFTVKEKSDGSLELCHELQGRCNKALAGICKKDADKNYEMLVGIIAQKMVA
ncbi:hypothetical protein MGG_05907 [Pyricularia oryzae 70-15]|uniref:DUF7053 domain-containing protein n=3 Tax=Pyricularia oryzae TaxID=318829 RepID=G4N404_PYRO7|nr:uncharacterized protein MGG_05907 [Pyricularia oryzae 70-15]EHA51926.1 hypothetical protein MGG_05907 [Pyricularia oryzae 70-15]ELQ39823.1 hypothetical protein OOU_Y34scaffold00478g4 [Pyricularia oryzae Y34]KAI7914012.1 hypothetical protein M0657_009706 [Pyricularia oryzae]KAI7921458.1 hypothetical protein M9X92_005349 [Pyricularia oryzae]